MAIRTTISIPDALKDRMNAVTERVNWSAVASAAFENEIAKIEVKRRNDQFRQIVERLKGTMTTEQQIAQLNREIAAAKIAANSL